LEQVQTLLCLLLPLPRVEIMPAKKKGPSMRENQQRKLTMQKIAKGGPQLSGVKKPAPATPSAGRRINPKAAKPKAAPKPAAKPQMVNSNSATMRQIQAKADAARARAQGKPGITGPVKLPNSVRAGRNLIREGANRMRNLADSGQVRAAAQRGQQAVEAAKRNRARLAAGVGKGLKEASKLKGAAGVLGRAALPLAIGAQAKDVVGGFQRLANSPFIKGRPKPATPKPAMPRTVGPIPKRLVKQGLDAQEAKARKTLAARKKAAGSKEATPNTAASFDDAFRDARRAKVKTFTWRGKKYTTEMK
jgi:hypothetical protein